MDIVDAFDAQDNLRGDGVPPLADVDETTAASTPTSSAGAMFVLALIKSLFPPGGEPRDNESSVARKCSSDSTPEDVEPPLPPCQSDPSAQVAESEPERPSRDANMLTLRAAMLNSLLNDTLNKVQSINSDALQFLSRLRLLAHLTQTLNVEQAPLAARVAQAINNELKRRTGSLRQRISMHLMSCRFNVAGALVQHRNRSTSLALLPRATGDDTKNIA